MPSGKRAFQFKHLTATAVVAGATAGPQAILHTVTLNNVASTAVVTIYDDTQTGSPVAANVIAIITGPTAGINGNTLIFDCEVQRGIAVIIATAAADITVNYA